MEVLAHSNKIRMSSRKVRLVVDSVRGKTAPRAIAQLLVLPKAASIPVRKLIESAVANAEHNFNITKDNLYVKSIEVNQGPMLKRWRARAFGRAAPIAKHSCHISVALAPIQETGIKTPKASKPVEATLVTGTTKEGIPSKTVTQVIDVPTPERAKESHEPEQFDIRRHDGHPHEQHSAKGAKSGATMKKIFNRKAG